MPRISREMIKVREAFSVDKFRAGLDIEACQNALMTDYGHKMNPYRIKEIFDSVKNESAINPNPSVPSVASVVTAPTCKIDALCKDLDAIAKKVPDASFVPIAVPTSNPVTMQAACHDLNALLNKPHHVMDLPLPTSNPSAKYQTIGNLIASIENGDEYNN